MLYGHLSVSWRHTVTGWFWEVSSVKIQNLKIKIIVVIHLSRQAGTAR